MQAQVTKNVSSFPKKLLFWCVIAKQKTNYLPICSHLWRLRELKWWRLWGHNVYKCKQTGTVKNNTNDRDKAPCPFVCVIFYRPCLFARLDIPTMDQLA